MPAIAVDVMGSDGAPRTEVQGALAAVRDHDVDLVLVGDEARVRSELGGGAGSGRVRVLHAPEVIGAHDPPSMAVKQKKKSSMRVCFDLVKSGEAAAVVSAGSSGAMMACGLFVLGRLPGVERPAIVTTFPTRNGVCALLDMGANVDPKASVLAQFAVLGSVYARVSHGKSRPRVGLLSNGAEEHKGTALTRGTHALLQARAQTAVPGSMEFDYLGYIEGRDIFRGGVDVVVTDGFTGNVMLKSVEGAAEVIRQMILEEVERSGFLVKLGAFLMLPALRRLEARTDWAESGGAPLLGVAGVALICHGASTAKAIRNAILLAARVADAGLEQELAGAVARQSFLWEPEKASSTAGGRS